MQIATIRRFPPSLPTNHREKPPSAFTHRCLSIWKSSECLGWNTSKGRGHRGPCCFFFAPLLNCFLLDLTGVWSIWTLRTSLGFGVIRNSWQTYANKKTRNFSSHFLPKTRCRRWFFWWDKIKKRYPIGWKMPKHEQPCHLYILNFPPFLLVRGVLLVKLGYTLRIFATLLRMISCRWLPCLDLVFPAKHGNDGTIKLSNRKHAKKLCTNAGSSNAMVVARG